MGKKEFFLTKAEMDRIIEMAWEDRTPFEAIQLQFGLRECDVIKLMRRNLQEKSFDRWRKRMSGRVTKHQQLRPGEISRFRSRMQRTITGNKISKR